MMRRTERAISQNTDTGLQDAGNTVNLSRFQSLTEGKFRQDTGETFGQHGLAGAGRADHKHVMISRCGDL